MDGLLGVRKGAWTKEEDDLLKKCVDKYGEGKWHQVPSKAGLNRCRKSCRLRWLNYLKADIKRGEFAVDEVDLLLRLHKLLGNRQNIASTTTTRSMDNKNNTGHQEESHSDPISPLEKDIKWWESLLYDTLEANAGNTCSTGSGSDGEPNKMEKFSAEQVDPAAAGSNIGIGEAFVEDHKSFWRDLISIDIDLWDL
ncbi:hypothetical protein FNV43_RR10603 [Rhamnella rubrinervis]|uniref:Uncharacterized protein n=1 Tax=Rhamnella rubrinervis TaxID=2594499 RepID=A0A8K0H436_9ROSA|nr:hypothetical protein FNV43_RR10603 [Rhamnella rubrinervis]